MPIKIAKRRFQPFLIGLLCVFFLGMAAQPAETVRRTTKRSAPDFSLPTFDGEMVNLSDFRGKNPVMLVFFATWCAPCNTEVPILNKIYRKYRSKGLVLLAIDVEEPEKRVRRWVDARGAVYPVVLDQRGTVAERYGVFAVPTSVLVNVAGEVTFWHNVLPSEKQLKALVASAAGE